MKTQLMISKHVCRPLGFGLMLLLTCGGCIINTGTPGSGVVATESRSLSPFNAIDVAGIGTYEIAVGQETAVTVTCDDNLLPLVETEVKNGELRVRLIESISPTNGLKVSIRTPRLDSVDLSGACLMNVSDLNGESFKIEASGANTVSGNGAVRDLTVDMSGACKVKLSELRAKNVVAELSGACGGAVYASESISAELSGAGKLACVRRSGKTKNRCKRRRFRRNHGVYGVRAANDRRGA